MTFADGLSSLRIIWIEPKISNVCNTNFSHRSKNSHKLTENKRKIEMKSKQSHCSSIRRNHWENNRNYRFRKFWIRNWFCFDGVNGDDGVERNEREMEGGGGREIKSDSMANVWASAWVRWQTWLGRCATRTSGSTSGEQSTLKSPWLQKHCNGSRYLIRDTHPVDKHTVGNTNRNNVHLMNVLSPLSPITIRTENGGRRDYTLCLSPSGERGRCALGLWCDFDARKFVTFSVGSANI